MSLLLARSLPPHGPLSPTPTLASSWRVVAADAPRQLGVRTGLRFHTDIRYVFFIQNIFEKHLPPSQLHSTPAHFPLRWTVLRSFIMLPPLSPTRPSFADALPPTSTSLSSDLRGSRRRCRLALSAWSSGVHYHPGMSPLFFISKPTVPSFPSLVSPHDAHVLRDFCCPLSFYRLCSPTPFARTPSLSFTLPPRSPTALAHSPPPPHSPPPSLGADPYLPTGYMVSTWWVLKQNTQHGPTGSMLITF